MKLIYAIVNNDDAHSVSSSLTKSGFQATKLASTGGFLMSGNTTFLICSEDDKIDEIIEIIKDPFAQEKAVCSFRRIIRRRKLHQLSCRGICRRCDYLRDEHREI